MISHYERIHMRSETEGSNCTHWFHCSRGQSELTPCYTCKSNRTKKWHGCDWDRAMFYEKGKLFIRCVPCRSSTQIGFSVAFSNTLIDTSLSLYCSLPVTLILIHSEEKNKNMSMKWVCVCTMKSLQKSWKSVVFEKILSANRFTSWPRRTDNMCHYLWQITNSDLQYMQSLEVRWQSVLGPSPR